MSNHKSFQRIAQDLRFDKLNERIVQLRHNATILTALIKSAVNKIKENCYEKNYANLKNCFVTFYGFIRKFNF
ncbi:hypothetical protein, partial [Actinobacillus porcinus]|uniref:hypothetical protein n=1 Tax=Actinobacillus porcinus TaxID=51048 RepID=UPI0023577CBA